MGAQEVVAGHKQGGESHRLSNIFSCQRAESQQTFKSPIFQDELSRVKQLIKTEQEVHNGWMGGESIACGFNFW